LYVIQGSNERDHEDGLQGTIRDLVLGTEFAASTKDRADYLELRAKAQITVPEDQLVESVRKVLAPACPAFPADYPLHLAIAGGTHDVVYVATEHNTIYAIDASSGTILKSTNLGSDVPHPLGCRNNGPSVGITAAPVIDVAAKALYVIACVKGPPESMNSTPSI
jgi:PQQ enzyme repeat